MKSPSSASLSIACSIATTSAFSILPSTPASRSNVHTILFAKVGVFFGTSTGSTEEVADMIVEQFGELDKLVIKPALHPAGSGLLGIPDGT